MDKQTTTITKIDITFGNAFELVAKFFFASLFFAGAVALCVLLAMTG